MLHCSAGISRAACKLRHDTTVPLIPGGSWAMFGLRRHAALRQRYASHAAASRRPAATDGVDFRWVITPYLAPSPSTAESLMSRSATKRQSARAELGALPEWNLADLYPAPDSPLLRRDLDRADRDTKDFAGKWRGRLAGLPGGELAAAIAEYEALSDLVGRIGSYAALHYVGDTTDP